MDLVRSQKSLERVIFVTSRKGLVKRLAFHMQIYSNSVGYLHSLRLFRKVKKMVNSCVAANCTNKSCLSSGTSLHTIPYYNDDRPEGKRRRKIWIAFVKAKRVFVSSKASTLCSAHFKPEDYEHFRTILSDKRKVSEMSG